MSGEAVQPVDEVDGVGDADYPEDGDGHGEHAEDERLVLAEDVGVHQHLDDDAVGHGDDGGDDLDDELDPGPERDDVVYRAAGDDEDGAEQNAAHLAGDVHKEDDAEDEAEEDGQAAHAGDGVVVDAAGVLGHVHGADLLREGLDYGR